MITVSDRQSVADIAVQHSGSMEAMYDIARDNEVALDADIAGSELDVKIVDKKITSYYDMNDYKPASYQSIDNEVLTNDSATENIMYNEENIEI